MKMKLKSLSKISLLLLASLVISIGLAEILVRHFVPLRTGAGASYKAPNPVYGWSLLPNIDYTNSMLEAEVRVEHNSMGFRDVEHTYEKEDDIYRIVVLGDSYMEGYTVNLEDLFHRNLRQLALRDKTEIETINLGVGGYGTLQEYLVFRDIGRKFTPDLVLLGFYPGNDLRNNSIELEQLGANHASLKVKSRPFLSPGGDDEWEITRIDYQGALQQYLEKKEEHGTLAHMLSSQSAIVRLIRRVIRRIETNLSEAPSLPTLGSNFCVEHPIYTDSWNITRRILQRLKEDVSRAGSELVVFTVPAIYETDDKKILYTPDRDLVCRESVPAYGRLENILNDLGIQYINLLPGFRKSTRVDMKNLYRRSDGHWNENGHHLAAEIVYAHIKNKLKRLD